MGESELAVQSKAKTVDDYLQEVPEERKAALVRLREFCRKKLAGFDETMDYGMPSYGRSGEVEVAFASQKNHISLYILKQEVMDAYKDQIAGKGISFGKGCIRYSNAEKIDFEIVGRVLQAAEKSDAPIC